MTQVIQELHKKNNFPVVHYEDPPIGITALTSAAAYADNDEDVSESRASFAETVIKAIADDKVCVVGVYGPGGVGKSKLLANIERQAKKEKLFDVVVTEDVSRNPDLRRIQGEIAYALGLKIMNEETARGRADLLHKRLESNSQKNILIILDNLWKKLKLNEVGIPCGFDNKVRGCKLLLTSRNRDVLRTDMGSDKEFRLNELEHGEARRLFERTVGNIINDLDIKPWVNGVVKNCGGLPLLIVSSAKRLKHGELAAWRNASTHRDVSDVKSIAEQNYNDLGDERIRKLFLVCALDSSSILLRCTLPYCMGLGLYKQFSMTIESARDRLVMDLRSLQNSSLLLDGDDIEDLKMHDIFVDMAISITSIDWKALIGRKDYGFKEWSKDELSKCTAISFRFVGIDELPEKLDCPNLKMLLLSESNKSLKFPESFFESMEKLQVLDLTCLSFTSLPTSIKILENLNSLCLDYCHLEDVTLLGKLKGLQFLSFHGSIIARLPKEIGGLTELRFLDLTECFRLQIIEPGVLESLVNLEELYIDGFCQWEAEDEAPRSNASLADLKNMKKLRTLHITIPHSTNLSSDLPFGNLKEYKIQIGAIAHGCDEYKESRSLKLNLDSGNLLREACMQECLGRTQDLCLDGLQDDRDSIHDLCTKGFQELKHLCVINNLSLQYVVGSTQSTGFMRLESLVLQNLNNLKKISRDCLTPESFSKLKIVKVENCDEIKHFFPSSMTRIFLQLEEIEINRCHLMQQIVGDDEIDEYRDEIDDDANVKSCKLRRLTLQNLPEMMSFYKTVDHSVVFLDGQQILFPSLEELTVVSCGLMKIWHNELSKESFCELASITIRDCENLSHIFPSNKIEVFKSLEMIEVVNCTSLESLIEHVAVNTKKMPKSLVFRNLKKMKLWDLPRLDALVTSSSEATLSLPSLTTVSLRNCHSLRYLFTYDTSRTLVKLEMLDVSDCNKMQKVVAMEESEERNLKAMKFSRLQTLKLCSLKSLISFSLGSCAFEFTSLTNLSILECTELKAFILRLPMPRVETTNEGTAGSDESPPSLFDEKLLNIYKVCTQVLFPSLEELKLSSMCQLKRIWHNQLHGQSFCKLASLTVELCENFSHVFPSNSMDMLQSLSKIEVVGCPSLEALFEPVSLSSEERQKPLELSALKKMKLLNLPRLTDILKGDCEVTLTFPSLMELNVRSCPSLSYLFSSTTAKTLHELAVLDISCCNNLRGIIVMEEGKGKTAETFEFRHLAKLKLGDLKSLICFSLENCAGDGLYPLFDEKLAFPKLEELHIKGVQQKELWNSKILMESFCCLKTLQVKQCHNLVNVIPSFMSERLLHYMESLTVEECPSLRNLFTMSMAKSLGQLQYLGLSGCGEMEYIVTKEDQKSEEAIDKIVIPQLVTLYLHIMPKLRSFCQGKHISEWPSLKEFTIEDCKAVKVILGDAGLEGNGPTYQPLLLVEKVEFPAMESMKILHMDNMEKIWLDDLDSNAFGKLKTLVVEHCEKLLSIFSSYNMLMRFQNLEKITVTDCGSLEVAFQVQEFEFSEACSMNSFQLGEIVLTRLPKMKHVWNELPRGGFTFGHLQHMEVVKCESLKSLFPSSVAKNMTQFKELLVMDSGVEEIIAEKDGVGMSASDLFFPQLTNLKLLELPKLGSFYQNSHTLAWPLLKQLRVRHCGKMRSFLFACEFQGCQGTTTSKNQSALFSFEKEIDIVKHFMLVDTRLTTPVNCLKT
ncbi:uncharacterized protein LOC120290650 [Eucalyptus grandis]|uniref:uncharacterized protein LOC120290650 n=1 Tax=Eucalyptus grandis TaxID=71139 RepID=UPI00192F0E84|nr:uncharacterized protein LOC120290650 [Eucalyptus grandis]